MPKSSKAQEAQNKLRSLNQGQVDIVSLDLNSLELTRKAADEIADKYGSLDVLINNAGLFAKQNSSPQMGLNNNLALII